MLDAATGFYRMQRYRIGNFFGPVDMGIHLAFKHNALTIVFPPVEIFARLDIGRIETF